MNPLKEWEFYDRLMAKAADFGELPAGRLLREAASFVQAVLDPENQPSQFGTMTTEYHEREMASCLSNTPRWHPASEVPTIPRRTARTFIVAVRRGHDGKVYTFPAAYLNGMVLIWDDYRNADVEDTEAEEPATTGWFSEKDHHDYDVAYYKLIDDKADELIGWTEVPTYEGHHE